MNKHSNQNSFACRCNSSLSLAANKLKGTSDSNSSRHYACVNYLCTNIQPTGSKAVTITFPNNKTVKSIHIGLLPCQNLPLEARIVHVFPDLKNKTLKSLGQLCDSNVKITLEKFKKTMTPIK